MKTKVICIFTLLIAAVATARLAPVFPGWDRLKQICPDIFVARCGESASPGQYMEAVNAYTSDSRVNIISVLKGTNSVAAGRLQTDYDLVQNDYYLVFGHHDGGFFTSYGPSGVIPLGRWFTTNSIAGKSMDEQIQVLLKQSLDTMNWEIQRDQQVKQRLEAALKN